MLKSRPDYTKPDTAYCCNDNENGIWSDFSLLCVLHTKICTRRSKTIQRLVPAPLSMPLV